MLLYCDTSALIKVLIEEPGTDRMQELWDEAEAVAVCRIAWAEAMAAMARRQREDPASTNDLDLARDRLAQCWEELLIVEVRQTVVETAGQLAEAFALRGYDSVQLAAANTLYLSVTSELSFASFDRHLNKAAEILGMNVHF